MESLANSNVKNISNNSVSFSHSDALVLLKNIQDNSVDLILIDPPYAISRETGFKSTNNKDYARLGVSFDFGEWDNAFTHQDLESVMKEAYRVLRKGGTIICFYDLWKLTDLKTAMESVKFKQLRLIEWIKSNPVPLNQSINYLTNAREIAVLGVKVGKPTFNGKYDNGVYSYPITREKRFHPTQKPVKFMSDLIEKHSNVGDLVVDCFSGSGTTAVAAIQTSRMFVGCERDQTFFDKASDRINSELAKVQHSLF
jgi:site-specific DNA-methyltransferase (adenine-specific)